MRKGFGITVSCLAFVVVGCSTARISEREEYWRKITADQVRPGTTLELARTALAGHGLQLRCCVSGPDNRQSYFGSENNVGRFFFTEYSVVVIVNVSKDGRVQDARVERWGVGL
jgi:hypothetical protein